MLIALARSIVRSRYFFGLFLLTILMFIFTAAHAQQCSTGCTAGLQTADKDQAGVDRAVNAMSTLTTAANANGIPVSLLAGIGVIETDFEDVNENGGANVGVGVFQITVSSTSGVTAAEANDLSWAANWAANLLHTNMAYITNKCTNFTQAQILQATAATYNMGLGLNGSNITCNPATIDQGTNGPNGQQDYGAVVMQLTGCF